MKALGYICLLLLVAVAALEIGGIAYAWLEGQDIAEVYPWTLPMTDAAESPESYRNAWLVVACIPALVGAFIAVLVFMPTQSENHGSARFARPGDMTKQRMYAKSGVILGKNGASKRARLIRQDEQTHTLLVAPTGGGKGVGVIIPNLLTYGGSVVCVDVKGENWRLTAQARKSMGDSVYRFSPRAIDGCSHRWNPLSYIASDDARRLSELRQFATYLFPVNSASSESWIKGARNIFVGICLYVLDHGEQKTLGEVYRSIFGPGGFANSIKRILATDDIDPECRNLLSQYMSFAEDQLSGYMGSLEPLNLWSDVLVDAATSENDFDLRELRRNPTSIYLAVGPDEIEELAPLLRLFFQQVMGLMQRKEPGEDEPYPVLMVMDEFRTLGKIETVLSAITTIRGFGGRFLIVVQGLSNLTEVYGREGRDNIVQNCGFQIFYTMSDQTSAEYVSKRLGKKTVKQSSKSFGAGRTPSRSYSEMGKDLMSVDEIGRLDAKRSIIVVEGGWPVKAWRIRYYDEDRFLSLVSEPPSPPLLRTRAMLRSEAHAKPAIPVATAPVEPKPAEPPSTSDKDDASGGGATLTKHDHTAEPRAFLDAQEAALASAGPARNAIVAKRVASERPAVNGEDERQIDTTDEPVSTDSRFDLSPDDDLYAEAQRLAVMHKCPHIADEVQDITTAVSRMVRG